MWDDNVYRFYEWQPQPFHRNPDTYVLEKEDVEFLGPLLAMQAPVCTSWVAWSHFMNDC